LTANSASTVSTRSLIKAV